MMRRVSRETVPQLGMAPPRVGELVTTIEHVLAARQALLAESVQNQNQSKTEGYVAAFTWQLTELLAHLETLVLPDRPPIRGIAGRRRTLSA